VESFALSCLNVPCSDDKWGPQAPFLSQVDRTLQLLDELQAAQEPFRLVDSAVPFEAKAARLLRWLEAHPGFRSKKLKLVDNLPTEQGGRGVVAAEPIAKGETVLHLPQSCMLSTATAVRTHDLGFILLQPQVTLKEMPTVLLAVHLMAENAKALLKELPAGADAATDAIPALAAEFPPTEVDPAFLVAAAENGIDVSKVGVEEEEEDDDCGDAAHGSHGHSHGKAANHGHSHGGKPCHGHGHGGAAKPAAPAGGHGHSHGGKPCHGHGHGADAEEEEKPLIRQALDLSHPWGSAWRAYVAMLPERPASCLYFTAADMRRLEGLPAAHEIAKFIRNTASTYLRLAGVFGAPGAIIEGLEPFFTWAHFRWAMSCVMSRQNRVPLGGRDPLLGEDACLALSPLYDMFNSRPGPITSYSMPSLRALLLDAPQDVAEGAEVTMSYGGRQLHQLLQFQGFVPAATAAALIGEGGAAAGAGAAAGGASAEAAPGTVTPSDATPEYALVEAALEGLDADPFFRIRTNVLRGLEIKPEALARRHLESALVQTTLRTAARAVSLGVASIPKDAVERLAWGQPFMFQVYADGTPSVDLLSFLRAAAIAGKADAATALRNGDAARRELEEKAATARARQEERTHRALERRAARAAAAGAPGAGAGGDAEGEEEEEGEEEHLYYQLALTKLSDANEVVAREAVVGVLTYAIRLVEAPHEGKAKPAAAAAADGAALNPAVESYRAVQLAILRRGLAKAQAELAAAQAALAASEAAAAPAPAATA